MIRLPIGLLLLALAAAGAIGWYACTRLAEPCTCPEPMPPPLSGTAT